MKRIKYVYHISHPKRTPYNVEYITKTNFSYTRTKVVYRYPLFKNLNILCKDDFMDKNIDFNNFYGFGYPPYPSGSTESFENGYADFNPIAQYEQGYMYYRFLTQQLEYKIKCKEFEKLCNSTDNKENRTERRVC